MQNSVLHHILPIFHLMKIASFLDLLQYIMVSIFKFNSGIFPLIRTVFNQEKRVVDGFSREKVANIEKVAWWELGRVSALK